MPATKNKQPPKAEPSNMALIGDAAWVEIQKLCPDRAVDDVICDTLRLGRQILRRIRPQFPALAGDEKKAVYVMNRALLNGRKQGRIRSNKRPSYGK